MHVCAWRDKARDLRIQRIFVKFVNALKFANDLPWPLPLLVLHKVTHHLYTREVGFSHTGVSEISIFPLHSDHVCVLFLDTRLYLPLSDAPNTCEYASMLVGELLLLI
jgi:hypothetical protein